MDDFGIKYTGREHADHLLNILKQHYELAEDWNGSLYGGIKLEWDYDQRRLFISIPGYVIKQLIKYKHPKPGKPRDTPLDPAPRRYGKEAQDTTPPDESPKLDAAGKKYIQGVTGSFIFYGRAVDPTIAHALSEIASEQAEPTEQTLMKTKKFMDYMWTHPDAVICYYASDMILQVHSDASYLTAPRARSRVGGHFFLGMLPVAGQPIFLNGAIHVEAGILKHVAASAAEAELGGTFVNAQRAKVMRLTLEELGHPQPPTPISIDNTTAVGICNNTIKRQHSRSMEMRHFWLLDHEAQHIFSFHHVPGAENLGDYPSKAHDAAHHRHVRPYYLHMTNSPRFLPRAALPSTRRGCVETIPGKYVGRTPPVALLLDAPTVHIVRSQVRPSHALVAPAG